MKHTSAFNIKSSSGKRRKTDNNRRKKETEKRTDEKEATKLKQRNLNKDLMLSIAEPFFLDHLEKRKKEKKSWQAVLKDGWSYVHLQEI